MQKDIGGMMGGALLETEARAILNKGIDKGIDQTKKEIALRILKDGELPIDKDAKYSGLDIAQVKLLVGFQMV